AIVEQNHDEQGIIWPISIAPFQVHIIPISAKDQVQWQLAAELYNKLNDKGIDVLIDDRAERAGVKFNDSDLIGIRIRIVVGKGAEDRNVEFVDRIRHLKQVMSVEEALAKLNFLTVEINDE